MPALATSVWIPDSDSHLLGLDVQFGGHPLGSNGAGMALGGLRRRLENMFTRRTEAEAADRGWPAASLLHVALRSTQVLIVDQDAVNFDPLRQLDQQLGIAVEVMNLGRLALREG